MHILIIPTWYVTPERPDLGIYFREQALALVKSGQKVGVLYVDFGLANVWNQVKKLQFTTSSLYKDEGTNTLRVEAMGVPKRFIWSQEWYAQLVSKFYHEYCQKVGVPDVIHAQGYTAGFVAAHIKQQYSVPFIYSEHTSTLNGHQYPAAHTRMLETALQQADAITTVSTALSGWLGEKTTRSIQVIPNLVDTEFFKPDLSKKPPRFTFLYVGDLIPIKSPDLLLRAFAAFCSSNPDKNTRLEIVGTGYLRESLEKLVQNLLINDYVHFHGLLPATLVVEKMQQASCLVLSSKTETFGVVQTEAMACGLPVIATDCGGPADIVTRETGLLVKVGDVDALANAMATIFKNSTDYDPVKIRASAVARFGSVNVARKWMSLYSEVIELTKQ